MRRAIWSEIQWDNYAIVMAGLSTGKVPGVADGLMAYLPDVMLALKKRKLAIIVRVSQRG